MLIRRALQIDALIHVRFTTRGDYVTFPLAIDLLTYDESMRIEVPQRLCHLPLVMACHYTHLLALRAVEKISLASAGDPVTVLGWTPPSPVGQIPF